MLILHLHITNIIIQYLCQLIISSFGYIVMHALFSTDAIILLC